MNLWTPGQHIITPRCKHCGRFRREWLRKHRRHAGSVLLLGCCCESCPCEDVQVHVTFEGIETCGCQNVLGSSGSHLWGSLSAANGTYGPLPFLTEGASTCSYQMHPTGEVTTDTVFDQDNCEGNIIEEPTYLHDVILVIIFKDGDGTISASSDIFVIQLQIIEDKPVAPLTSIPFLSEEGPGLSVGEAVPNSMVCADDHRRSGHNGTATVTVAC